MSGFQWDGKKRSVAMGLAEGYTQQELAAEQKITDRTIRRWLQDEDFKAEVDRLSLMIGIASRAGRLRIAHKAVRKYVTETNVHTEKDVLDWLKFAQSETNGIKTELAASLADLIASVAERSGRETEES